MAVDRAELAEKMHWVEDNIDTMDGNTPLQFNQALVRMSGGPGGLTSTSCPRPTPRSCRGCVTRSRSRTVTNGATPTDCL
jgi:hypothetical protein